MPRSVAGVLRPRSILRTLLLLLPIVVPTAGGGPAAGQQAAQSFTVDDLLDLRSLSVQDITPDGALLACTISRRRERLGNDYARYGDPTYIAPGDVEVVVIEGESGRQIPLFDEPVQARGFTWSPDGATLAFFMLRDGTYRLHTWERASGRVREARPRTDLEVASGSTLEWLPDGSGVLLELRAEGWAERARAAFLALTEGPVIVHDGREPFLRWDEVRGLGGLTVPAVVNLRSREVRQLLPEGRYGSYRLSEDGTFLTYQESWPLKTAYERGEGTEYELALLDLESGEKSVVIERSEDRPSGTWNRTGDRFAHTERGDVLIRSVFEEEARNLTEEGRPYHGEEDTTRVRFSVMRFGPDDQRILCSGDDAWWLLDAESGEIERIYDLEEDEETRPRLSVTEWSPDGRYLYLTYAARDRWERGLMRFDIRQRSMEELLLDSGLYRSWELTEDGRTFYYQASDGDHPNELFRADTGLRNPQKLTDLNPWLAARQITRSELVSWLDVDGERLYGILYYPVNYEEGKRYPLVCEIYETFLDNGFNSNMNMLAGAGFFGFRPSVNLEEGYPGESWVKGVTTGINMLIERGLVDPERLGVHGTSYGGYATALLITQTDRFAAAINISGKVNMVSFYGDSPRLGVRNITAPERGQDRIGGSLWEYPERYLEHSAIMFADRIQTPLMLITGDFDYNVPARQSMEMYYAMRRLDKEVVWVRYADGGHSPPNSLDEYRDYWNRIIGWYVEHFEKEDEGGGLSR